MCSPVTAYIYMYFKCWFQQKPAVASDHDTHGNGSNDRHRTHRVRGCSSIATAIWAPPHFPSWSISLTWNDHVGALYEYCFLESCSSKLEPLHSVKESIILLSCVMTIVRNSRWVLLFLETAAWFRSFTLETPPAKLPPLVAAPGRLLRDSPCICAT